MITEFALPAEPGSFALLVVPSTDHEAGEVVATLVVAWSVETDSSGRRIVEPVLASNEAADSADFFGFVVAGLLLDPHGCSVVRLSGDDRDSQSHIRGLASSELGVIPWIGDLGFLR